MYNTKHTASNRCRFDAHDALLRLDSAVMTLSKIFTECSRRFERNLCECGEPVWPQIAWRFFPMAVVFFAKISVLMALLFGRGQATRLYTEEDPVVILSSDNLKRTLQNSSSAWLLQFYSSWCGHCIQYSPTWKALAGDVKGNNISLRTEHTTEEEETPNAFIYNRMFACNRNTTLPWYLIYYVFIHNSVLT